MRILPSTGGGSQPAGSTAFGWAVGIFLVVSGTMLVFGGRLIRDNGQS